MLTAVLEVDRHRPGVFVVAYRAPELSASGWDPIAAG
jgi:hypothetical protein